MQAIISGAMFLAWSVAVVLSAVRKPAVARVLPAALFISMGVVNIIAALSNAGRTPTWNLAWATRPERRGRAPLPL
jgi:hypothetical protein